MSANLSCSALNCTNNASGSCVANAINVSGPNASNSAQTECDTFLQKGAVGGTSHFTNANLGGELKQMFANGPSPIAPMINCEAEGCTFNSSRKCTADSVEVKGDGSWSSRGTRCETFRED